VKFSGLGFQLFRDLLDSGIDVHALNGFSQPLIVWPMNLRPFAISTAAITITS
jgi:hypothetical protein